jgi:hypothetical protein
MTLCARSCGAAIIAFHHVHSLLYDPPGDAQPRIKAPPDPYGVGASSNHVSTVLDDPVRCPQPVLQKQPGEDSALVLRLHRPELPPLEVRGRTMKLHSIS